MSPPCAVASPQTLHARSRRAASAYAWAAGACPQGAARSGRGLGRLLRTDRSFGAPLKRFNLDLSEGYLKRFNTKRAILRRDGRTATAPPQDHAPRRRGGCRRLDRNRLERVQPPRAAL